mmetsp:Transcript_53926/g.128175  ORF Transcript_53926/g.128175 Transcript_53926/m.128175 type:complete len:466 (-) Transcript_53926:74-1471(-)
MATMDLDDGLILETHGVTPPAPVEEVTPSPNFDLETYVSSYTGSTKATRLRFIAERVPALQQDALRMLLQEVKSGQNVQLYKDVLEVVGGKLGPAESVCDQAWVDKVQEQSDKALEKLEVDLCQHKLNSIKEKVRMGHNDLGHHFHLVGNLNEALKCFVRTRDYGTNAKHLEEMCLNVIRVAIEMGNYSHVVNYVNKAEQNVPALEAPVDPAVVVKLRAASGLAHLDAGKYKLAALKFCAMKVEVGKENSQAIYKNVHPDELGFSEALSAQDVAIYGGICALATFDRTELAAKVVEDTAFKQFLELVPEMRELIADFYGSRYSSCLAHMATIKGDLQLDIYMAPHVTKLYGMIRSRALVQYFTPFASVRMPLMAEAFSTTVPALQKELSDLIMKKEIKARIDAHNQILHVRTADQEASTFEKALATGVEYERQTGALLLRLELIRNDLSIKVPRAHAPPRDRDDD